MKWQSLSFPHSSVGAVHRAPADYPDGNGGQESQCGWCKDKWDISWQIPPRALTEAMAKGADADAAKRAFEK